MSSLRPLEPAQSVPKPRSSKPRATLAARAGLLGGVLLSQLCGGSALAAPADPRPPSGASTAANTSAPGGPPLARRGAGPSEAMRRELLARLASERAWRLVDGLKLDQAASARIFPVLSKYDELFFKLFDERRELNQQLRAEMAAATPNDARLTALVDKLVALRGRRHTLENERLAELRKLLTPWQQAMLVTLLPRVEVGFLNRIRQAKEHDGRDPDGSPERDGRGEHRRERGPGGLGPEDLY